ncbi:MAG: error-prone DNA polymerase [Pirellulales bacterium]|nr:error-prone DNA polymerase [Pirellulales bacterium]
MSYVELHAKTNFSFLEAASHPDELVCRAAELGYAALAITDRNSLAGVVRAHVAAKEAGLKLIIGAEITPDDAPPLVVWAADRASYGRLSSLITQGRRLAEKGECRLTWADVAAYAQGLLAGVLPGAELHCSLPRRLAEYRAVFGERCYLLAELHRGPDDAKRLEQLSQLARRTRVPLAAAGGVCYHVPERQPLLDVLTAIRLGTTVAEAREHLFANAERYLKPPAEMALQFARFPEAVHRGKEIADRCTFSLDELRYEYPEELAPQGQTPMEYLTRLAWAGARKRYPGGIPEKVRNLIEHELRLIEELHYEAYFLTVWDLVRFARRRGILCQGRGSAANSAVCYCLGVTAVDPDRTDVLFERFVSRERNEAPDIDVDFEHERREEVIQYLYEKYGRDRAGMTAEVITYRPRSAVRDVGKALGLSLDRVDALAKRIEPYRFEPHLDQRCREVGIDPESMLGRQWILLVDQLVGFPRHLSQHTGGMVMTRGLLRELVPIENAAMPERTVIQWNKDDLDELGILKVDCLALGMLTAIRKCFQLVERHHGRQLTLAGIPEGGPEVYAMIRRADTMGVFQIESRAQMSMLPRLRPRCFYDLVIEVAIVRPGPIQGNMVHPYLRRRNGEERVTYPNETIRAVLEKTLGVPLFQEQAMRLAMVAAGFTPGEADQLRRAMGAWRKTGLIDQFRKRLIEGMLASGMSQEYADATFQQIRGFGEYGFPESHAASFALLVYVSAWLKHHYPAAFCAALLNSQPMGFYAPAQLVRDARQHGVEVLPVDVNHSQWDSTLENREGWTTRQGEGEKGRQGDGLEVSLSPLLPVSASPRLPISPSPSLLPLRLGFRMLHGMAESHARRIEQARGERPFCSMEDFSRRTGLGRAVIARLAKGGAFASLELDRRGSLWHALAQQQRAMPLFDSLESEKDEAAALPPMSAAEEVLADYRTAGMSLKAHPLKFLRAELDRRKAARAEQLKTWPNGHPVRVAGIVLVRQRPGTAKGITFVTLEDETGVANLIIRPDVWQRWRQAAVGAKVLLAHGRLQRHGQVIHVVCTKLENLSELFKDLAARG